MSGLRAFLHGLGRAVGINPTPVDSSPEAQVTRARKGRVPGCRCWEDDWCCAGCSLGSPDEELGAFFDRNREGQQS